MAAANPVPPAPPAPPAPNKFSELLSSLGYVLAGLSFGVIIWALSGRGFLTSLSDRAVARGLITFLVTFTTIIIAIILAVSTISATSGDTPDQRFDKGKQVLGLLIGLLGTIVGFYFGSSGEAKATPATEENQALVIAPANVSNLQPKKCEKFTIASFVSGGKAPYTYSITFDPPLIPAIKDVKSTDGVIRQEIGVPDTLAADSDVKYEISVTDSENKTGDYNKNGAQKISLKAK